MKGTVVIDPGHGGTLEVGGSSANNATSPSGVLEKNMTLRMGLLVRDAIVGDLRVWFLDRATVTSEVRLTDPGAQWVFEGVGAESPSTHR